jgi:hypothetical protein
LLSAVIGFFLCIILKKNNLSRSQPGINIKTTISSAIRLGVLLYELMKNALNKKGKKKDPLFPKKVFEW